MSEKNKETGSARNPIASAVFYLISILLLPISALGYVIWIGKLLIARKSGVSMTAQEPLSARWFQHHLCTRLDEPANQLMMVVPGVSPLAVWLVFGPSLLAHRLSGYVPKSFRYPFDGEVSIQVQGAARQTFYDSVLRRYLPSVAQLVILGAGFDTRAFRLPREARVRSFEVDTPKTQSVKREILEKAGIDTTRVSFVAANFEKEDWLKRLVESGFDPNKATLFIWEGVTPYLDRTAVEDTLRKIAGTARGSIVAFDYFTIEVLESQAFYMRYARAGTQAAGEPLKFGIDSRPPLRERLVELLQSCRLTLIEQRTLGQETVGKRAWGGFAIATVT
jgi:methyltransferase (TIGR00027 family)